MRYLPPVMPVINCQQLTKTFGPKTLLAAVTLTIRSGERVGLVGNNGSGKSTLGKILAGLEEADGGVITRKRGAHVGYLAQEPSFSAGATPREVVLAGLAEWGEARCAYDAATRAIERGEAEVARWIERQGRAAQDIERLGGWERMHEAETLMGHLGICEPDALLERMSGGERRRVALAVLLVRQPDLLILDEPTNHLDVLTIEWLEQFLIDRYPGALLLITHDRYVLNRVVTRTLELSRGEVHSYAGGYEAFLSAKAEREAQAERVESNRQNFLRRELEWLRRQPKARGTKAKARVDRARETLASGPPAKERAVSLGLENARSGKTILELRGAGFAIGGNSLFRGLDFDLVKGERIGIVGPNGTGKTSFLRCILGEASLTKGELCVGRNTVMGYLDQRRSGLCDEETILENVAGESPILEVGGEKIRAGSFLEKFLFDGSSQRQKVGVLSGGERARVCLAKLLSQPCNLLLLDEPTNDLDVATLGALEEMLLDYEGCALIVSHDRWFLDRVATSILAFEGEEVVDLHRGDYTSYKEKKELEDRTGRTKRAPSPEAKARRPASTAKPRKLSYKEQRELDGLFGEIERAEARAEELEAKLADPATYQVGETGGEDIAAFSRECEAAHARVEELTARWEELEAIRTGE